MLLQTGKMNSFVIHNHEYLQKNENRNHFYEQFWKVTKNGKQVKS